MWRESMRDQSIMKVDIWVVKPRAGTPVADTLKYVFKYSTKVGEIIEDPNFLYGLTDQLRGGRFVATGGVLKGLLKKPENILIQEEVERLIDREAEVDRKINFMKSGGVGVRDYAAEYEEEVDFEVSEEEAGAKESVPIPMSDADFAEVDFAASEVERYEKALSSLLVDKTVWEGNHPLFREVLQIARKRLTKQGSR